MGDEFVLFYFILWNSVAQTPKYFGQKAQHRLSINYPKPLISFFFDEQRDTMLKVRKKGGVAQPKHTLWIQR